MRPLIGITPDDCPFCDLAVGKDDSDVVAFRDASALAFPSLHQRDTNRGHMLVVPSAHVADIYRLPSGLYAGLLGAVAAASRAVRSAFDAQGITVHQHNEYAGGQDAFHLHFHVIPRFSADSFYDEPYQARREVPIAERCEQAALVRQHLSAPDPPHPADVHGDVGLGGGSSASILPG